MTSRINQVELIGKDMLLVSEVLFHLRVQDEPFSEENDLLYSLLKMKIVSAGIRTPNSWVTER